jgi:acetyl esterase/lipase
MWLVSWINDFAELSRPAEGSLLACPLLFGTHRNIPPAYIQTCCLDPFRDSAIIYEHLLRAAGSPTNLDVYPGLSHGFWAPFPMLKAMRKWVDDIIAVASWLLDQGQKRKTTAKL